MPTKHDAFRKRRSEELIRLYREISKFAIVDPGPLSKAGNEVLHKKPKGAASWGYSLEPVTFNATNAPDIFPLEATGISVEVSMDIAGDCVSDDGGEDPITSLAMDMIVRGYVGQGKAQRRLSFYWHLDRDLRELGDGPQEEFHPRYHFQHGGHRVPQSDYTIGDTLFMDPPRLNHPPMDAILAVDFVLANFCTALWRDAFGNNAEYADLLAGAQRRCWKPYYLTMAKHWDLGIQDSGCLDLQPCLVPNAS